MSILSMSYDLSNKYSNITTRISEMFHLFIIFVDTNRISISTYEC